MIAAVLPAVSRGGAAATNPPPAAATNPPPAAAAGRADAERKLMDAWNGATSPGAIPMSGVSFPVSHHRNGGVRLQFRADKALLPSLDSDYVRARGITLELFDQDGALVGTFHGENGLYDRAARVGFCEGPVLIADKDVRIDGTNMIWDLESRSAKILRNARVVIRGGMMDGIGRAFL